MGTSNKPNNSWDEDTILGVSTMAAIFAIFIFIFGFFIGWWFALCVVLAVMLVAFLIVKVLFGNTPTDSDNSNNGGSNG